MVLLEIPTEFVENSINVSEEVKNEKRKWFFFSSHEPKT